MTARAPKDRAAAALIVATLVTAALYLASTYLRPWGSYVGYPLVLFSTFAHEMGHGVAAVLVGGHFDRLFVYADTSGLAYNLLPESRVARAFTAFGGLVGPAVLGGVFFVMARHTRAAKVGLGIFGGLCLVADALVVRNAFGILFVGLLGAACLAVALRAARFAQTVVVFLAIQLSLSVFSRGDYLFTPSAHVNGQVRPSDVGNIADNLFLPYWLWGALIGAFSVLVLVIGAWGFLGAFRKQPAGTRE